MAVYRKNKENRGIESELTTLKKSKNTKFSKTTSTEKEVKADKSKESKKIRTQDSKYKNAKESIGSSDKKNKNPKDKFSSFQKNKKNEEKVERGPTKRELREELSKTKKAKSKKVQKEQSIVNETPKKIDNSFNSKKTIKKEKIKMPRPLKKRKENTTKVFYTPENINSFLLEAKSAESKENATNMLLFVLRNFKSNPSEVLAKVKILTSGKHIQTEGDNIQISVLKHICAFYKFDSSPIHNLFKIIETNSLFSKYLSEFIFSASYDSDQYDHLFNEVFNEICKVSVKSATLSFTDFLGYFYEIDSCASVENYKLENFDDDDSVQEQEKLSDVNNCDVSEEPCLPSDESESSELSAVSLISLNDDDEIDRLDRTLGQMFGKGMLSIQEQDYLNSLSNCLEILIKSNYHLKIENLIRILYLCQFESISQKVKFIVKDFLSKIGDQCRVFRIFQISALINSSVYTLYNTFYSFCGVVFDLKSFMTCVFNFGHEEFVLNKIDKDAYYLIYNSTLGKPFDDFLILLIQLERREDKLKEMQNVYFNEEIKQTIEKTLVALNEKQQKKTEINEKKKFKKSLKIGKPQSDE